jgi:hypothetical protein
MYAPNVSPAKNVKHATAISISQPSQQCSAHAYRVRLMIPVRNARPSFLQSLYDVVFTELTFPVSGKDKNDVLRRYQRSEHAGQVAQAE